MTDFENYENEVFNELPEKVIGCNFKNCTFNVAGFIERSNLDNCIINAGIHFYLSNVVDSEINSEECVFELSNNVKTTEALDDNIIDAEVEEQPSEETEA